MNLDEEMEHNQELSENENLERDAQDLEDIDELLEEPVGDVPDHLKNASKSLKRVLVYRGLDHFDVLPDGWVEVTHSSGLPVYLHKKSRCCTFSRPYFIGPGSVRLHSVPESAIPCLFYHKLCTEAEQREGVFASSEAKTNNCADENGITPAATKSDASAVGDPSPAAPPFPSSIENSGSGTTAGPTECPMKRSEILEKLNAPAIKIKTSNDVQCAQLTPSALHEYARRRLKFKNISVYRFGKWREARNYYKARKLQVIAPYPSLSDHSPTSPQKRRRRASGDSTTTTTAAAAAGDANDENLEEETAAAASASSSNSSAMRPGLSGNFMLITVPSMDNVTKPQQKNFFLNPQGKTSVSILHELIQKILHAHVRYFYSETRNTATPYNCVAKLEKSCANSKYITGSNISDRLLCLQERYRIQEERDSQNGQENDVNKGYITVGEGCGTSKKHAKLIAAKKAVENLFSGFIEFDNDCVAVTNPNPKGDGAVATSGGSNEQVEEDKFQIFENLDVCDSRVPDWSARAGQPAPYLILQEYLKRHSAFGDTEITTSIRRIRYRKHRFEMHVGNQHHVTVDCPNKHEGKQKAAQAMLKKFLPEKTTWGSILRVYGYEAQQKQKEAIKNKESIIKLQGEVRLQNEKSSNNMEPNNIILDKLKSEMMKISESIIDKRFKSSQLRDGDVPAVKRARLEAASGLPTLTDTQVEALEALLSAQRNRRRADAINTSELPILSEIQLRELSAMLTQLFPNSAVKVPSLT